MNAAQIHLALNHVPLFLSLMGGLILILGMIRKNESFINLSLFLIIAAALFTAPVFLTGEGTEEIVEGIPGIQEPAIENHEDMAKISLIIIVITGITALIVLFFRKNNRIKALFMPLVFLLSLASFAVMAQTAHLGGKIRHTEISKGQLKESGDASQKQNNEDDD